MGAEFGPLIQTGAIGVVLAWFLFRIEPRIRALERAVDRFSRVMLLDILSRPSVSLSVTREAQQMIEDIHREKIERSRD